MAVRLNAAADYLYTTSGAPTTADHTVMLWFRINTDRNATGVVFLVANSGGTEYLSLYLASDGTSLRSNSNSNTAAITALTAGTWYHLALVRSGTSNLVYVNGALAGTHGPVSGADFTPASMYLGSDTASYVDGDFYAFKTFNAALTAAQVAQEMYTVRPVNIDVLRGW